MPNAIARVVIPLAIVSWLLAIVVFREGTPGFVVAAFVVAFVVAVPVIVFKLMADLGWSRLTKGHRVTVPFDGDWRSLPTAQMSTVGVDAPEFERNRLRLVSALRIGIAERALYLQMLFSRIPILGLFFPNIQIDWSAIKSARSYEAPGWFRRGEPGALLQANYDPNYTGRFVELEVGDPSVFIQLPEAVFGEQLSRLPLASSRETPT